MKTKEEILDLHHQLNERCLLGFAINDQQRKAILDAMETYAAQFQKDDRAAKTAAWIDCEVALPTKTGNYEVWDDNSPLANKIYVMRFDKYNETWLEGEDTYHPQKWRQQSLPPESDQ